MLLLLLLHLWLLLHLHLWLNLWLLLHLHRWLLLMWLLLLLWLLLLIVRSRSRHWGCHRCHSTAWFLYGRPRKCIDRLRYGYRCRCGYRCRYRRGNHRHGRGLGRRVLRRWCRIEGEGIE